MMGGEHSRKEPFEQLFNNYRYSERAHKGTFKTRIRIRILNTGPDRTTQINTDPFRIRNLVSVCN
jgi:hypothetical protein